MIKVNKNAKQNIFSFILGAIIFGGISAYAATIISSSSVSYSNTSSGITSTNVQGAIDELYNKAKNPETTATATKEQILSGQTAWVNGVKLTGTMLNQGAKTATINPGGSYTIPAGYHNGSGKITANPNQNSGTYTYAANSTGGTVDLGVNNTYRYVNAANVYAKGKADGSVVYKDIDISSKIKNGANNITSFSGIPNGYTYVVFFSEKAYSATYFWILNAKTMYGWYGSSVDKGIVYFNILTSTSQLDLGMDKRFAYVNGNWYYYETGKIDRYWVTAIK